MPDRRGRKGSITYPIAHDKDWAAEIWRDREDLVFDVGMLREAAQILKLDDDDVQRELDRIRPLEKR